MDEARWERKLKRERARNAALERAVEDKTRELYLANEQLRAQNESLEDQVQARTLELKQSLAAVEAGSRAKTQFLAHMSHELRTPLHGLSGTIEALNRTELRGEQQRLLQLCQSSGARLMRVIGDVLDFSRIESGKLELDLQPMSVEDVANAAASSFAAAAKQRGLLLTSEVDVEEGLLILADSHRIAQVLANLLSNAVKFTERGSVTLRASSRLTGQRARIRWEVEDTGCGMEATAAANVFDAFRQAEPATTRRFGGTGLGLSIVKGLVEAMGGTVRVQTVPGVGSTFCVETEHDVADPERPRAPRAEVDLDLAGKKVLVVDDHPINRMLCESMLQGCGAQLLFAVSGEEAVAQVAEAEPDLVLMDCHMPGISGIEATRVIRGAGFEAPILAVSADVTTENAAAVVAAGMQGILGKPFRQAELFESISDVITAAGLQEHAPPEAPSPAPLLEVEAALARIDGDVPMFAQLCEVFLEELDGSLRSLRGAAEAGDAAEQRLQAHTLKSASAVVGAERLRLLCFDMEQHGRAGRCTPEALDELEQAAQQTAAALRAELARA